MTRLFLSFLLLAISHPSFAQDIYDKMSKKLCKCLEKEKVETFEGGAACMETIMLDNLPDIVKHHGVSSVTDIEGSEVAQILMARLAKGCLYARTIGTNSINVELPNYQPDKNISCLDLQIGEYYYLTPNSSGQMRDTTFITFSKSEYMERMNRGRTYARLSLEWKTNCSFELTFIESNDPFKNNYSKPGDKYVYEIIRNKENSVIIKSNFDNQEIQFECFKL